MCWTPPTKLSPDELLSMWKPPGCLIMHLGRYTKESGIYLSVNCFISDAKILLDLQWQVQKEKRKKRGREKVWNTMFLEILPVKKWISFRTWGLLSMLSDRRSVLRAGIGLDNEAEWILKPLGQAQGLNYRGAWQLLVASECVSRICENKRTISGIWPTNSHLWVE